jgi:hypothetical protein
MSIDLAWDPRRQVWKLTAGGSFSLDDLHVIIEKTREKWAGGKTAILVARDLDFGVARMFQVFAEGIAVEFEVFRDVESAYAWLAE